MVVIANLFKAHNALELLEETGRISRIAIADKPRRPQRRLL
jgi:hypothetical protein